jgi:hypothetical protein
VKDIDLSPPTEVSHVGTPPETSGKDIPIDREPFKVDQKVSANFNKLNDQVITTPLVSRVVEVFDINECLKQFVAWLVVLFVYSPCRLV